ncbi:MAG: SRPBCC family protein [Acidimicrobiales bacterium]|jgi:uncharacterized protein YndB with AHSA1/START domain
MTESSATELPTKGSATVEVNASAADVYALLTDLDRLPTLSPENQRCEFLHDAAAIATGVRFRGHNKKGDYEWHADCEVTVADVGKAFAYIVPPDFKHATTWGYDIESTGPNSCTVTEWFDAPMLALPDVYPGQIEGRCENLEKACLTTMENLRAAFDGS